jgi:hypothetical protein
MNDHTSSALLRPSVDDLGRRTAAGRQGPLPRRRHMTRPRDALDDIAHVAPSPTTDQSHGPCGTR